MSAELERLSALTDDALMEGGGGDFARRLRDRAWRYAQALYDPGAWELLALDPALARERMIFYLRRRSWAEWYFGTVTPSRQIVLLRDRDAELALRLSRQIKDEVRHHDAFGAASRKLGGEWRVGRFPAPENLVSMRTAQEAAGSAGELAAANQLAGEVVLLIHGQTEDNVLASLVSDDVQDLLYDIETDEPAHVEIGHDLVAMEAVGPWQRRLMALTQERFLSALGRQHTAEIEQLGARRRAPLPAFGGRS